MPGIEPIAAGILYGLLGFGVCCAGDWAQGHPRPGVEPAEPQTAAVTSFFPHLSLAFLRGFVLSLKSEEERAAKKPCAPLFCSFISTPWVGLVLLPHVYPVFVQNTNSWAPSLEAWPGCRNFRALSSLKLPSPICLSVHKPHIAGGCFAPRESHWQRLVWGLCIL